MLNMLKKFIRDEEGQDFVEYALLLAGIAVVAWAGVEALGPLVDAQYDKISAFLTA